MDGFDTVYLDASVVIRRMLNQPGALKPFHWKEGVSSELLLVEIRRTLHRLRILGMIDAEGFAVAQSEANEYAASIELVPVSELVLARASGPFPSAVATLDAIHLSSALLWAEHKRKPIMFLTHDSQLGKAALFSGFEVYPSPTSSPRPDSID